MKKRLIAIFAAIMLAIPLSGCTTYQEAVLKETKAESIFGGYFTVITKWSNENGNYYIAYANDTGVKYILASSKYRSGISPLYNADGTLQVYEE